MYASLGGGGRKSPEMAVPSQTSVLALGVPSVSREIVHKLL